MHQNLLQHSCLRFVHNQEIPCSIDQSTGHHTFRQGCCINVFCRHICPILRSLDFGQFHSLCTEFLLNPQVSGFHVSHSTETSPSPYRDDHYCGQRNARSQRLNTSQEGWIEQTLPLRLQLCMRSILLLVTTRQCVLVSCRAHECTIQPHHHCSRGGVPRRRASCPVAVRSAVQTQSPLAWPELQRRVTRAIERGISPLGCHRSRPHEV